MRSILEGGLRDRCLNSEYSSHTIAPWQIALLMISLGRYLDMIKLVEDRIDYSALESLRGIC